MAHISLWSGNRYWFLNAGDCDWVVEPLCVRVCVPVLWQTREWQGRSSVPIPTAVSKFFTLNCESVGLRYLVVRLSNGYDLLKRSVRFLQAGYGAREHDGSINIDNRMELVEPKSKQVACVLSSACTLERIRNFLTRRAGKGKDFGKCVSCQSRSCQASHGQRVHESKSKLWLTRHARPSGL